MRALRLWVSIGLTGCAAGPEPARESEVPAPPSADASADRAPLAQPTQRPWPGNAVREMQHDPCDTSGPGSRPIDVNGDGKPDVVEVSSRGVLVCKASDLNFDGGFDVYTYFDAGGAPVRVERDLDFDQKPDQILFKNSGADVFCTEVVDRDGDGSVDSFTHVPDCADRLK